MNMMFCPLFSSSSGNATFIGTPKTRLLVDAGMSALAIGRALEGLGESLRDVQGVLITHEHSDHTKGLATLAKRYGLPLYANEGTWEAMPKVLEQIPSALVRVFQTGQDFYIKDVAVRAFDIPHDAASPVGFLVSGRGKTACTMTDLGYLKKELVEHAMQADVVLIESNHDEELLRAGPYPQYLKRRILSRKGHLCNQQAGEAVAQLYAAGVRRFYLGHLSRQNNREDMAIATVCGALGARGITPGKDIALCVAQKEQPSPMTVLK